MHCGVRKLLLGLPGVLGLDMTQVSFRSLCETLVITQQTIEKETKPRHFMKEARLINDDSDRSLSRAGPKPVDDWRFSVT